MPFQFEANLCYGSCQKAAQKQQKKDEKQGEGLNPKELNTIVNEDMVADKVELGVMEIPVDQIVGVADDVDKELYASNFMPLSPAKSAYADQWRQLYLEYRKDKAFESPLLCFEYLGKFYVEDGKKRVSVLKNQKTATVRAYVIRIIPTYSEEKDIKLYYEFLVYFTYTKLYQVRFSKPDCFVELQKALGYEEDHIWNDEERECFLYDYERAEMALQEAFGGWLNITAADALLVLLQQYPLKRLRQMAVAAMADYLQTSWKKLYGLCYPEFDPNDECLPEQFKNLKDA